MSGGYDIAVVGGGIVGCSIALESARRGARVVLLEAQDIGSAQSSRSLGFLNTASPVPEKLRLSVAGLRKWHKLPDELDADLESVFGGHLVIAESRAALQQLTRTQTLLAGENGDARIVQRPYSDVVGGGLGGFDRVGCGALWVPTDGHTNPRRVMSAYRAALLAQGVEVREQCGVKSISRTGKNGQTIETTQGPITAKTIVLATGTSSRRLLSQLEVKLPILVIRGFVLETTPVQELTEAAVMVGGWTMRQTRSGSLYVSFITKSVHDLTLDSFRNAMRFAPSRGRSGLARVRINRNLPADIKSYAMSILHSQGRPRASIPIKPTSNRSVVRASIRRLNQFLPDLPPYTIASHWGEPVDITPDDLPVIGPVPGMENLYVATGFSGHGLTIGPYLGELLAESIDTGQPPGPLARLRLTRFEEGDYVPAGPRL